VQGVNDTLLMVVSGTGTLISGFVIAHLGWHSLLSLVGWLVSPRAFIVLLTQPHQSLFCALALFGSSFHNLQPSSASTEPKLSSTSEEPSSRGYGATA
jgi:hypothetical protein